MLRQIPLSDWTGGGILLSLLRAEQLRKGAFEPLDRGIPVRMPCGGALFGIKVSTTTVRSAGAGS